MRSIIQRLRGSRLAWIALPALLLLAGTAQVSPAGAQAGNGTLIVQKQLVDAQGQTAQGDLSGYSFTLSGGGITFNMGPTNAQGQATASVASNVTYTLTEQAKPGGATFVGVFTTGGVQQGPFQVPAGGTLTLVARNQVAGTASIAITKQIVDATGTVVAGADRSGFTFTITGPSATSITLTTDANGTAAAGNLAAGSYTVTEQPKSGFQLVQLFINGVSVANGGTFTLTAGQTSQVVAQNRAGAAGTGTVTIQKQLVDAQGNPTSGDRSGFQFTITCGSSSATATTDANGAATVNNVPSGSCTISETARTGFTLVSITVGTATTDIGNGGSFTVTAGQTTAITVRNRAGTTGQTEQIQLFTGCNNVAVTWPTGTATSVVAAAISPPSALIAIWRFDNASQRFVGYSPIPNAPNDLNTVNRFDPVFICVNSNATLTRPVA